MNKFIISGLIYLIINFIFIVNVSARPFGMQTMTHINTAIKQQVRRAFIPVLKSKKEKIEYPKAMVFSKDYHSFAFLTEANYISIWNLKQGNEYFNLPLNNIQPIDIAINHSNNELFVIDQNSKAYRKTIYSEDGLREYQPIAKIKEYQQIKSVNNTQVLSSASQLIISPNIPLKKAFVYNLPSPIVSFDITSNSKNIVVATENKVYLLALNKLQELKEIKQWDLSQIIKQVIIDDLTGSIAIKFESTLFSNSGYALIVKSGNFKQTQLYPDSIIDFGFTNNGQLGLYTKNQEIIFQNLATGKIDRKLSVGKFQTEIVQFYNNDSFVYLPVRDKGIHLIETKSATKQAQLVSTKNGWAILDNSGRYDGNEEALSDISWEINGEMFELDRFSKRYFEPGLLAKVVHAQSNNLKVSKKPLIEKQMITQPVDKLEEGVFLPPQVTLKINSDQSSHTFPKNISITITAKTTDEKNTLETLRFYHNGKRLKNNDIVSSSDKGDSFKKWELNITPTTGKNTFLAEVGGWGDIFGQSETKSFTVKAKAKPKTSNIAKAKPESSEPQIYIKSIGIDEYTGKELDLNFAVADATDIYKVISDYQESIREGSRPKEKSANNNPQVKTLLLNNDASKKKILSMLDDIKKTATTQDTLFIFMSGHGQVVENKWYFLPQEANTLLEPAHVKKVGLSSQQLADKLVTIPNQKIVLIVDACQSGAATEDFNNFQQRRDLSGLSKDAGIHIMAATRADQLAPEYSQLGHGIFTYILLNGLKKNKKGFYNADLWPKDGKVMISELKKYTAKFVPIMIAVLEQRRVKQLASRGAANQRTVVTPVGSSIGKDFQLF